MEIARYFVGRDNNLNLLRVCAAMLVIWAHAWGRVGHEPVAAWFGVGTGDIGVDVFFFLSGLLVSKSFENRGLVSFAFARAARIYPGLWVSTLVLVGLAALFSPLGTGLYELPTTWSYVAKNFLVLPGIGAQLNLPHAFGTTQDAFNTPLWTLPQEISMYMLLGAVGLFGGLKTKWAAPVIMLMGIAGVVATQFGTDLMGSNRARFIAFFFCGVSVYVWRERVKLDARAALALAVAAIVTPVLTANVDVRAAITLIALPYITLWLAFVPRRALGYNRVGDYSYGLYIYGYPVQVALYLNGVTNPVANFASALLVAGVFAVLSWHLIEKRALRLAARSFTPSFAKPSPARR